MTDGPRRDATQGRRPTPSLAGVVGHLLRRAHAASLACGDEVGFGDRHPSELAVLTAVAALGPASQRVLGERIAIDRTTMVQIIDRLEGEGLVARKRDPSDRRNYAVTLTPAGRRVYGRLRTTIAAHTACLTRNLTPAQRRRLNALLLTLLATPRVGLTQLPSDLADRTGFLVARVHLALRGIGRELLRPLGIEPQHFAVLTILDDLGPISQRRLADELGVSATIVVKLADHLEGEGLVERRRAPEDRRVQRLTLTPDGLALLPQVREIVAAGTAQFTKPIGAKGAKELERLLVALLDPGRA